MSVIIGAKIVNKSVIRLLLRFENYGNIFCNFAASNRGKIITNY